MIVFFGERDVSPVMISMTETARMRQIGRRGKPTAFLCRRPPWVTGWGVVLDAVVSFWLRVSWFVQGVPKGKKNVA